MKVKSCCDAMSRGQEDGTDNEGYLSAIYVSRSENEPRVGSCDELGPIKFCPWCGKDVELEEDDA